MATANILIYLIRRDLRVSDNPVLHSLATQNNHSFTHLLPIYIFPAEQIEVSGFIPVNGKGKTENPYPEARSQVGGFWRCGPHRAKFLAESVWDLKRGLEDIGSGLCIRVGMMGEVLTGILEEITGQNEINVEEVWITGEEGVEEQREEEAVEKACKEAGVQYRVWGDEKYFIDEFVSLLFL